MDEKLLSLPWQIQAALGAGYLAYLVAYSGIRDHHNGVDTSFRAIAFGLIATLSLQATSGWHVGPSIIMSCVATVAAGIVWRAFGRPAYRFIMRKFRVSWADDAPSAWNALALENTKYRTTQLSVKVEDGRWHHCTAVHTAADWPHGPFVLGNNGDIAMYVDKTIMPDKTVHDYSANLSEDGWGQQMTFIPAHQIKQVEMRFLKPS